MTSLGQPHGPTDQGVGERWRVFRNTHLMGPVALFERVVRDDAYDRILDTSAHPLTTTRSRIARRARRVALRVVWWWPRVTDADLWARADTDSNWSPEFYLRSEPRRLLLAVMDYAPKHFEILDLGCNSGADLDLLAKGGWVHLAGVDAGARAIEMFQERFPRTFAIARVKHDLFQRYLLSTPSMSFDLVHSNGATLELVHPSFPIVEEICRVTRRVVMLETYERGDPYPRDYEAQFRKAGFRLTYAERPTDFRNYSSLLRFEREDWVSPS